MIEHRDIERCCRNCEYWDAGGEVAARTANVGDCHNSRSDRFTPEADHVCPVFYPNTTRFPSGALE